MVVDTSAILAVLFDEPHAAWAAQQLNEHRDQLLMSTVNLAECLIIITDRQPTLAQELRQRLLASGIRFVAPDIAQAQAAAEARLRLPLNLGDCFAYALSVAQDVSILTLDEDFKSQDRPVVMP